MRTNRCDSAPQWEQTPWHATQRAAWEALRAARLAARLNSFRELANSPAPGTMRDFVPCGDDNGDRPLDDLEQRHQCEPGVPGEPLDRMRLRNRCTTRLGVPTSHASYDHDAPIRGLRCLGRRGYRLPTSRGGHVRQGITAVSRRQDATALSLLTSSDDQPGCTINRVSNLSPTRAGGHTVSL
jgi:hypothetical protein